MLFLERIGKQGLTHKGIEQTRFARCPGPNGGGWKGGRSLSGRGQTK